MYGTLFYVSDHFWTVYNVDSTTVKHLSIMTACLKRPTILGSLGGLYGHVSLYINPGYVNGKNASIFFDRGSSVICTYVCMYICTWF